MKKNKLKVLGLLAVPLVGLCIGISAIVSSCSSQETVKDRWYLEKVNEIYMSNNMQLDPTATSNWIKDENISYDIYYNLHRNLFEISCIYFKNGYTGDKSKLFFPSKVRTKDGQVWTITNIDASWEMWRYDYRDGMMEMNDAKDVYNNVTDIYFDPELNNNLVPTPEFNWTVDPFRNSKNYYSNRREIKINNVILSPVFGNFTKLERLHNFPSRINFISQNAFRNCFKLTDFSFLNNNDIKCIGESAFEFSKKDFSCRENEDKLPALNTIQNPIQRNFNLPKFLKNLVCIAECAFKFFPFAEQILKIPASVKYIGVNAFMQEPYSSHIFFDSNIQQVQFEGQNLNKRFIASLAFSLWKAIEYCNAQNISIDAKNSNILRDSFCIDKNNLVYSFKVVNANEVTESIWPISS